MVDWTASSGPPLDNQVFELWPATGISGWPPALFSAAKRAVQGFFNEHAHKTSKRLIHEL
jgi:hypothetical protein